MIDTAIILVNWKAFKDTIECINSLLKMNDQEFQIIVCDNDSRNASLELIYEYFQYKEDIKYIGDGNNAKILLVDTKFNKGFGYGNNVGVSCIKENKNIEYIWLLNSDTIVDVNALIELKKVIKKKDSGMVGSSIYNYDNPKGLYLYAGFECGSFKNIFGKVILRKEKLSNGINGFISGASMFIRKKLYIEINGFDEKYFMYCEDVDLCNKVLMRKYKLYCAIESVVYHKEKAKDINNRPTDKQWILWGYYDLRNRIYCLNKFAKKYNFFARNIYPMYLCMRRLVGVILYDNNKKWRIKLLLKAIRDGYFQKMGITEL